MATATVAGEVSASSGPRYGAVPKSAVLLGLIALLVILTFAGFFIGSGSYTVSTPGMRCSTSVTRRRCR